MKVVRYYEGIFHLYQQKIYAEVITGSDSAIVRYPDDPLLPKFKYIRAMAMGALVGKEEMKVALDSLIAQHPTAEESQQAQEIVDYMYVAFPVIKEADQAREAEEIYTLLDHEQEHNFLIALHTGENVNQVSFDLLNYNLDHFNQYDLEVGEVDLTDSYNMLVVRLFNNAEGANRYLQVIEENMQEIMGGIPPFKFRMMIISKDNFNILSEEKGFNPYFLFYLKYYQNQE